MKGSTHEEGPGAGMLNRILRGKVRVCGTNMRSTRQREVYGIRKCRRERNYMGGKGREMWKEGHWRRDLERALDRILVWEVRDKMESTRNWRKCRTKKKHGNVERDTSKAKIVGEKIGRRAKSLKGWGTLSHTEA